MVTVTVSGVSDTNEREQIWQSLAAMLFTVLPAAMVTVGAVVDAMGIVNVCDTVCSFVHPQPPLHGSYEITPCTWIVAIKRPVPTCVTLTSENWGANTGMRETHEGKQRRCEMFTTYWNGEAVEPAASEAVMTAGWILLQLINLEF